MSRSNVLIQECSNFFCCDGLILTLNRDGDGFALLDTKSHDCHQLAHITGLAIFFNGDLAGIFLCQLDQQTGSKIASWYQLALLAANANAFRIAK